MKIKVLFEGVECDVVGVMDGEVCPVEEFLGTAEANTEASRRGLLLMLQHVSNLGIQNVPSAWHHEANKAFGISEFIKGPLRLFFFKGEGRQVAVCTSGVRKSGAKADKGAVARASELRIRYLQAVDDQTLEIEKDED